MVVFGHFVFKSLFTFLYVTCSFLDILQFLSISHLWIFRFTAHKILGVFYVFLFKIFHTIFKNIVVIGLRNISEKPLREPFWMSHSPENLTARTSNSFNTE